MPGCSLTTHVAHGEPATDQQASRISDTCSAANKFCLNRRPCARPAPLADPMHQGDRSIYEKTISTWRPRHDHQRRAGPPVHPGRVVRVVGRRRVDPKRGPLWPVTPVNQYDFLFNTERQTIFVDGNAGREHEEAWLVPILRQRVAKRIVSARGAEVEK